MSNTDCHTPTNFREFAPEIDGSVERDYRRISCGEGYFSENPATGFELTGFIHPQHAAFIVQAVNSHEQLVSALRAFVDEAKKYHIETGHDDHDDDVIPYSAENGYCDPICELIPAGEAALSLAKSANGDTPEMSASVGTSLAEGK